MHGAASERRAALDAHVELHRTRERRRALRLTLGVALALFMTALALVQVDETRARADVGEGEGDAEGSEAVRKVLLLLLTLCMACGVGPDYEGDHAAWIAGVLVLFRIVIAICVVITAQTLRAAPSLMAMYAKQATGSPMTPEVRRKVAYSSPGSAAAYNVRRRTGTHIRSSPSLQSPGYMNRPPSSGAVRYLAALRATPGNKASPMGTPSSLSTPVSTSCPNCASPLPMQGSPFHMHGATSSSLSDMDEAAYLLLQSLTVDWDQQNGVPSSPSGQGVQSVANVIDDWTDNLTRALSKYARENVIEPLERNTRHLVELNSQVFSKSMLDQSLQAQVLPTAGSAQQGLLAAAGGLITMDAFSQQQQQQQLLALQQQQQQQQPLEVARQRAMNYYNSMVAQQGNNQQAFFQAQQDMSMINRLLDERARLERSLLVVAQPLVAAGRGTYTRATVLSHLKSLFGSPDRLSKYQWDAASPPCDPDILVHLATDWLKKSMHIEDNRQVFLANSRRDLPDPGFFAVQQGWGLERITVPAPDGHAVPHFQLYFQGLPWQVRAGRQNALQAVALLIYSMKVRRSPGVESVEWVVGGHSFAPL
ncbi:Hypothetical Protein FCC1311_020232 [Hondaea fermentalgiana]|uniref:Uncharacterized protein n=1 Tax=Hondaea fermentalgiana TaxID=2315210 RepID=A0A2R5GDC2_9STRA|nr:Hypothetical Protein FCC1311_020232 [Hondaea fermentalgiana]|eukprot:GBG25804.1 Hypothetical Protein FCC1311_020232 [Hondaea fermentalgiana]